MLLLLAVAALAGVTAQRLCGLMSARLRSRRWIGYLRYSIGERNAHTISASRRPTSSRPSVEFNDTVELDTVEG